MVIICVFKKIFEINSANNLIRQTPSWEMAYKWVKSVKELLRITEENNIIKRLRSQKRPQRFFK
ncbi:MAG TPA: hypothetical protein DCP02_00365 [Actinobacteria bacterium]|nr:hypothetical protein [Actinomycetota bacterium]